MNRRFGFTKINGHVVLESQCRCPHQGVAAASFCCHLPLSYLYFCPTQLKNLGTYQPPALLLLLQSTEVCTMLKHWEQSSFLWERCALFILFHLYGKCSQVWFPQRCLQRNLCWSCNSFYFPFSIHASTSKYSLNLRIFLTFFVAMSLCPAALC